MRIIFAGNTSFSKEILAFLNDNFEIACVCTNLDKQTGRGRKFLFNPVKTYALENNLNILQCSKIDDNIIKNILNYNARVIVVVAYGSLIPKILLEAFNGACLNIHTSLLPKNRGAAPIERAIINADIEKITGVSIMQIIEELDAGPIYLQEPCEILDNDNYISLEEKLLVISKKLILKVLNNFEFFRKNLFLQGKDFTYAAKISKNESIIDWSMNAYKIDRLVRAFVKYHTMHTTINSLRIKIFGCMAGPYTSNQNKKFGEIIDISTEKIDVFCGENTILSLKEIQLEGSKRLPVSQILLSKSELFKSGNVFL